MKSQPSVLQVKRLSNHNDYAMLDGVSFEIRAGQCMAIGVEDEQERRLLLSSLAGSVPITDGILSLNGTSVAEETPHSRIHDGLSLILPKPLDRDIFPDERIFQESYLGYQKMKRYQAYYGLPWVGTKAQFRRFRRGHRLWTRGDRIPSLIVLYDMLHLVNTELGRLVIYSLEEFRARGGAVLLLNEAVDTNLKYIDAAGIIREGRMLGIVQRDDDILKNLLTSGGAPRHA